MSCEYALFKRVLGLQPRHLVCSAASLSACSAFLSRYIKRRAKEAFSTPPPADASREELMLLAKKEFEVVKRQAVVFNLYARKHVKSVMVGTPKVQSLS